MELKLKRIAKKSTYTIGRLYIDDVYFCDTLEDADRGLRQEDGEYECRRKKIKGATAIPTGRYRVSLGIYSIRFGKQEKYKFCDGFLPRLVDVPAYEGVLIHIGNTEKDTEGCILVGRNTVVGMVTKSRETFEALYGRLRAAKKRGEEIWITIE